MLRFLLVAVAAALIAGCGSSATKTVTVQSPGGSASASPSSTTSPAPPAGTTSSASQTGTSTAPAQTHHVPVVHVATFKSPSANIGCMIVSGTARCDIRKRDWSPPPKPASCPSEVDFGQGLIVAGSGAGHLVCAGDTTLDPSAKPLAYGSDTVVGHLRCQSRTSGVTCTNQLSGHGFFISVQGYRTF